MATRVGNFAKATVRDAKNGFERRTPEQVARIFAAQCDLCEFYSRPEEACSKCGCPVSADAGKRNKLAVASERCPLEKPKWPWPTIEKRNLIYYLMPLRHSKQVWQKHVNTLRKYLHLFNGRRIITIATKGPKEPLAIQPAELVREAFGEDAVLIEFIERQNDTQYWETPAFREMLRMVESTEPTEATFYFHAKGVRRSHQDAVGPWSAEIYRHNLGRIDEAMENLRYWPCCGIAKQYRSPVHLDGVEGGGNWHFAGTGFWFRHDQLFAKPDWQYIQDHSHAVEAYLSTQFSADEAYCLAHYDIKHLYEPRTWAEAIGALKSQEDAQQPKENQDPTGDTDGLGELLSSMVPAYGERWKSDMLTVATAADGGFFLPLQLMVLSMRLTNDVPVVAYDLGLDNEQLAWLTKHGVDVRNIPEGLPFAQGADHWQTWNKPLYIVNSAPSGRVLWIDADCLVRGSLEDAHERIKECPLVTGDVIASWYKPNNFRELVLNKDALYERFPVKHRIRSLLNAGVCGFDLERDREILGTWLGMVRKAAQDETLRQDISWHDQGALLWSLEHLGVDCEPLAPQALNEQVEIVGSCSKSELACGVRKSQATILHFAGHDKPYTNWPERMLDVSLVNEPEDLRLFVLGHDREQLSTIGSSEEIKHIYLPDIEAANDKAESRFFQWFDDNTTDARFAGVCTASWNTKYACHCWPMERLSRLPLSPSVAWCALISTPNWAKESEQAHPGMGECLKQIAAWSGIGDIQHPAPWSNNFIVSREVMLEIAEFHRWLTPKILRAWGTQPPYEVAGDNPNTRKLAYLLERVTMLWFVAHPDIELVQIPSP